MMESGGEHGRGGNQVQSRKDGLAILMRLSMRSPGLGDVMEDAVVGMMSDISIMW